MAVYEIDPVEDPRWCQLLETHPQSSVFHLPAWLEALRSSYGYQPIALTTTPQGQPLRNGLVLCKVKSWLTGARLVSLPFSDHCQPLVDDPSEILEMLGFLESGLKRHGCSYFELRPLSDLSSGPYADAKLSPSRSFLRHTINLQSSMESLYLRFHKSCIRRKLQRAQREGLKIEQGSSQQLTDIFYQLLLKTRRRHGLPPQPVHWFKNLLARMGDRLTIRVARKDLQPIAGILTLSFKKNFVYKYGASDVRYHSLGAMPYLLWHAMQEAKGAGMEEFDLGRSDLDTSGLIAFKEHLGGTAMPLTYYRHPSRFLPEKTSDWKAALARGAFSRLPDSCISTFSKLLYKHVG